VGLDREEVRRPLKYVRGGWRDVDPLAGDRDLGT
jgi:hypothetical protein